MSSLFDLFRRQGAHGLHWNGDRQRTLLHELDVEGRRRDFDVSVFEPDLELGTRLESSLSPDPARNDEPARRVDGRFHTTNITTLCAMIRDCGAQAAETPSVAKDVQAGHAREVLDVACDERGAVPGRLISPEQQSRACSVFR